MSYYDPFINPANDYSDEGDYYQIFGRRQPEAVEIYIALVSDGDDEFDRIETELGLSRFSTTVNDYETAEEWARYDARKIHPTLPVEIRFMESGEISRPSAMMLLPVSAAEPQTCRSCHSTGARNENWLSVYKWGHPLFCSWNCVTKWYQEIPASSLKETGQAVFSDKTGGVQ